MLAVSEEVIEKIHRKTLDEDKELFTTSTEMLPESLLSEYPLSFPSLLSSLVKLSMNNTNHHQNKWPSAEIKKAKK